MTPEGTSQEGSAHEGRGSLGSLRKPQVATASCFLAPNQPGPKQRVEKTQGFMLIFTCDILIEVVAEFFDRLHVQEF